MRTNTKKKVVAKWQYLAEDDIWKWNHSQKTHRTVSEAFKDADYAYAGWKPKSEWEDFIEFMSGVFFILPMLAFAFYIFYLIIVGKGY